MQEQNVDKSSERTKKKVALVHDFLVSYGGAERVFESMAELFPEAPIYTLLYDQKQIGEHFVKRDIRVSWLSRLPNFLKKRYRFFLPFFPVAVESFDLRDFDIVISSSGAWSKGIITRLHTKHIAYIHSPMRYAWDYHEQYLGELGAQGKRNIFLRMVMSYLRIWDRQSADRPDFLLVNSRFTQERVRKYYRRESTLLYPGALDLSEKASTTEGVLTAPSKRSFFLVVSRLTRSKKIDRVVEAFNKLDLPLVIVGCGPEQHALEERAEKNISFRGFVRDDELVELYRSARAIILPSEEDFGMVAVEALSFGTPVIAYEYGGIKEIIQERKTGELFHAQTPEIIAEGVRRFLEHEGQYDESLMRQSVAHFTKQHFQNELQTVIEKYI
ncbi:MAG: glycosyltransferase [Candidatus Moranbacteria bacterium]|nr:glycosyltransferase [Candidatus Moranbacteria bacterium]MDD3965143.1 glycosyltransferase [Candidatus Moranbacteria bacterium]